MGKDFSDFDTFIGNMNSRAEIFHVVFSPRPIAAMKPPVFRGYPAMDITNGRSTLLNTLCLRLLVQFNNTTSVTLSRK